MAVADHILSVAQMRHAEHRLIERGASIDGLMQVAGRGAAEWIWRLAGRRRLTVLCGPGNNGGDGYVIAEAIRARGGDAVVIAAAPPATAACRNACALYRGEMRHGHATAKGDVLVDCLFGVGLTRPLSPAHAGLLGTLADRHARRIAIDLPSGMEADSGMLLNDELPEYDLTIALGAWKFAHVLMPASAHLGRLRMVSIGIGAVEDAAWMVTRPDVRPPAPDAHKFRRGMLAVVGGTMPGAALLACEAAQGAGAGYVKLCADGEGNAPADLVVDRRPLAEALPDDRIAAVLIGPGLGRDATARERLAMAVADPAPLVADADALVLLGPRHLAERKAATIATPHEGELLALERAFACAGGGTRPQRARALAYASGMLVVAKGPDTVIAAPDGRLACAPRASSWLSVAGTGDVLAGTIASRLATGLDAFEAAAQGVWLHGEAARLCPPGFTAGQLARAIPAALAGCL